VCALRTGCSGVDSDVTNEAACWLFEPMQLADDVVLRDVFVLLAANPVLFEVFRRDWAEEITREARVGPGRAPDSPFGGQGIDIVL
jgi:hypothetical protein